MASNKEAHAYHAKKKRSIELMNNISDESSPEEILDDDINQ